MANWVSYNSGNFSDPNTWVATNPNAAYTYINAYTYAPQSLQYSVNTVLGADVISGILLYVASLSSSPQGTFTCVLRDTTNNVTCASVTVNVSDFVYPFGSPAVWSPAGWYYFKFASPYTTVTGVNYAVGVSSSNISTVYLGQVTATTYDWMRLYVETASASGNPTTGDSIFIIGQMTGTGAHTSINVTNDSNTGGICYNQIYVNGYSTFKTLTGASTSLTVSGMQIYGGGLFSMGSGTANGQFIASGNTANLTFSPSASYLIMFNANPGATATFYGARCSTCRTRLVVDCNKTNVLGLLDAPDWNVGDRILVAGSTAYNQSEEFTISAVSGTSVTASTNLTYYHCGTKIEPYDCRADVVNISNSNLTLTLRGVGPAYFQSTSADLEITNCFIYTLTQSYINLNYPILSIPWTNNLWKNGRITSSFNPNIDILNNVFYFPTSWGNNGIIIYDYSLTGNFDSNTICATGSNNGAYIYLSHTNVTNNAMFENENYQGYYLSVVNSPIYCAHNRTYLCQTNWVASNNGGVGAGGYSSPAITISACSQYGIYYGTIACNNFQGLLIDSLTSFVNSAEFGATQNNQGYYAGIVKNSFFSASSTVIGNHIGSYTMGSYFAEATTSFDYQGMDLKLYNCKIGTQFPYTWLANFDVATNSKLTLYNCSLSANTMVYGNVLNYCDDNTYVAIQNRDGITGGNNFTWIRYAEISTDSASAEAGNSFCTKLTPNVATNSMGTQAIYKYYIPVNNATARAVTFRLKADSNYNGHCYLSLYYMGNLVVSRNNPALTTSYANYTVTAPSSSFNDNGVMEAWIEFDGTVGSIYLQSVTWT